MDCKLPYYMAYPMPLQYDDERIQRQDLEYLKSLYPGIAKKILPYVEEECDRMEYKGCMLYDEYPDRLQLRLMCRRICKNAEISEECAHLAEVMLYHELYERRCDYRRNKSRFY